ncbi:Coatomer/clathrin adaptor appendage, Ig-like subdomain-containing protein [Baffinella frigidus]|nr:Coatomer/clathrin adaptor appendage, Ig-like subdomain-containing protein [Cryptophyta sp. CCMP2293]
MARLALNKEGVLYEDKLVQIGLKTALTATGGKLSLFVGNKADQQLTNFNLNVAFSPQITGACSTCAMFVDPKQQLQLVVTVDIRAPFAGPLPMSISFSVGDDNRTMNLTLPVLPHKFADPLPLETEGVRVSSGVMKDRGAEVLPHKFADPLPLEAGAFRSKWAAMLYTEPGVGVSVALQDKWAVDTAVQSMVSSYPNRKSLDVDKWAVDTAVQTMLGSSMKMAVQEGLPAGTVAGSASLTTPEGTATVLVQLEIDAGAKTASLLVRSDNPLVRDGFEAALQAILLKRA